MENNNNELIEHKIRIDDYLDMNLKIPKVLDVIEFTSVLEKARKMIKLSEISVHPQKRRIISLNVTDKIFLDEYKNCDSKEEKLKFAQKHGISSIQSLYSKVYTIKNNMGISTNLVKTKTDSLFDKQHILSYVEKIRKGSTVKEIAENLGIPYTKLFYKNIHRLIKVYTGKLVSELKAERI